MQNKPVFWIKTQNYQVTQTKVKVLCRYRHTQINFLRYFNKNKVSLKFSKLYFNGIYLWNFLTSSFEYYMSWSILHYKIQSWQAFFVLNIQTNTMLKKKKIRKVFKLPPMPTTFFSTHTRELRKIKYLILKIRTRKPEEIK